MVYGDRHKLVGFEVPSIDSDDSGFRVLAYDHLNDDFIGVSVKWSTGAVIGNETDINAFKIVCRYDVARKRVSNPRQLGMLGGF